MITKQNNHYSESYRALFAEAFELLSERDKLTAEELAKDGFTSLEEYFMHIGDLAQIHGTNVENTMEGGDSRLWNEHFAQYAKYLMLPLDEEYFSINANTRLITVPSIYAQNGVSLAGDQRAETLLFEIDRYFDFIDLLRTNIYVQWKNPAGEDGATLIHLIDYDDKKIRFGWTLSDYVTKEGNQPLVFSVRFFAKNDSEEITYSFNTLSATVKIRPALRMTIENTYKDEPPYLFVEAVRNGANSNTSSFPEEAIIYEELPEVAYLLSDTYTLQVGAYTPDTGKLSYTWKFKPYNDSKTVVDLPGDADDIITRVQYCSTNDTTRNPQKSYYIANDEAPLGYEHVIFKDDEDFAADTTYYEPKAQCIIQPSTTNNVIAGEYYVNITNTVNGNMRVVKSDSCIIPHPTEITYRADLNESGVDNILKHTMTETTDSAPASGVVYYTLNATSGEYEIFDGDVFEEGVKYYTASVNKSKVLTVTIEVDKTEATPSYQWYVKSAPDATGTLIEGATNASHTVSTPGWYYVDAKGTLNRVTINKISKTSKITDSPAAPTIDGKTGNVQSINFYNAVLPTHKITVNASVNNPDELHEELVSEGLTYEWLHQVKDGDSYEAASVGNFGVVAIANNELTVQYSGDTEYFRCRITNTLNGKTSTTLSDVYQVHKIATV